MNMNRAMELLNEAGIKAEIIKVPKNGKEIDSLQVGEGRVRPSIYQSNLDGVDSKEELIEFVKNAINSAPDILGEEIATKEYFIEHSISCIRHQTTDESIVKFPVYGDLEEYIRVVVDIDEDATGSIVVTKEHIERLGIEADEIRKVAREHLKEKAVIRSMYDVMQDLIGGAVEDVEIPAEKMMYVASTNDGNNHGAAVMLLDDVLEKFCMEHGIKSAVIIPSSIHEVLIICEEADDLMMDSMIQEVNETSLTESEILSDHCYHFSLEDVMLGCA